ncbi:hypothetical protein [Ramlibacter sp.]|uniref:hypothetical protein n=1 Tax=Ramlibacter sp. TaxID=1917967 RepID=UPI002CADC278|nr:hypothetical protein [Ramlibacter sp.]HWI81494.1 hypothetical protein [Ramlibacter sp.]
MSLFNWLNRDKQAKAQAAGVASSRLEPNRGAPADPSQRKSERLARRELLYSVVRESMARAGVLSASYKFKVLSLDNAGKQFLVMVDLAASERADADLLADIEAVIAQRAKTRHELGVSAVYWRRNDQVGVGAGRSPAAQKLPRRAPATGPSQPAELMSALSGPVPLPEPGAGPGTASTPQQQGVQAGFDPIQDDEMEAFRAALANGLGGLGGDIGRPSAAAAAPAAANARGQSRANGFADTEVRDDGRRSRTLSSTQSGDLN